MGLIGLALAAEVEVCGRFGATEDPVAVTDGDVGAIQSSGLAAARTQADIYYTHNDAGGEPAIYLFTAQEIGRAHV